MTLRQPEYAGLTSAEQIASRQEQAEAVFEARTARSSLGGLTLRVALQDMREALVGVPADLFSSHGPLNAWDIFTRRDRLRGLGLWILILVVLAVAVL